MKLKIRVIPNARKPEVIEGEPIKVKVRSPPEGGRANKEVIEVLAKHFGVPKSKISISKGLKSRDKIIVLDQYNP